MLQKITFSEADVYLQGAHLTRFRDWLFLSSRSKFEDGHSIRGGIPVVFPWFGPNRDDPAAPQHGWARTSLWTLDYQTQDSLVLSLDSRSTNPADGEWPFFLHLRYTFGDTLTAQLTIENVGEGQTSFEVALHSYFAVSDIGQVFIEGLDGLTYSDKTCNYERKTQSGSVSFEDEVDRVYYDVPSPLFLRDGDTGFELRGNWKSAVTWNPGATKATTMNDLGDGEWRRFACLEVGAIGENAITLSAGQIEKLDLEIIRL